jgi:hypothetical protein
MTCTVASRRMGINPTVDQTLPALHRAWGEWKLPGATAPERHGCGDGNPPFAQSENMPPIDLISTRHFFDAGRFPLRGGHCLSIDVHRRLDRGMPHQFLLHLQRSSGLVQPRAICVAERVPTDGTVLPGILDACIVDKSDHDTWLGDVIARLTCRFLVNRDPSHEINALKGPGQVVTLVL